MDRESSSESEYEQDDIADGMHKNREPGVIYLSPVPSGMTVSQTTSFFSEFGRVGRIFLQPSAMQMKSCECHRIFTEGWVEFLCQNVAKSVAEEI